MKKIITILAVFLTISSFSQASLQIGYANIGLNLGYLGLDIRLSNSQSESYTNIGAGTFLGIKHKILEILPEIHFNIVPLNTTDTNKVFNSLLMTELSATTRSVNPSIGINFLNALKIKCGYSFPYNAAEDFKGVTFGVNLQISGYKWKMM